VCSCIKFAWQLLKRRQVSWRGSNLNKWAKSDRQKSLKFYFCPLRCTQWSIGAGGAGRGNALRFLPHVSWHMRATWSVLQSDGMVWVAGAWNCGSCLIQERTNVSGRDLCACLFLHNKGVRCAVKKRYARLGAAADQITQIGAPVWSAHRILRECRRTPFQRSDQGRPNNIHKKSYLQNPLPLVICCSQIYTSLTCYNAAAL